MELGLWDVTHRGSVPFRREDGARTSAFREWSYRPRPAFAVGPPVRYNGVVLSLQVTNALDLMLDPLGRTLTPDAARQLAELRADPELQRRMDDLADRCNDGSLTADERAEYDAYVTAATLIAVLQAKARAVLSGGAAA
jgi:hypothetical protein